MELLSVDNLRTHFYTYEGLVKAVDGVTFNLERASALGIVGETGSGKTVTALSIIRLIQEPGRIVGGSVNFDGRDLMSLSEREMREVRGREISMIFQDPNTSLNPAFRIGEQLSELIVRYNKEVQRSELNLSGVSWLEAVGIPDSERRILSYPHELSGGTKQRVMIAMALLSKPKLLIADEPTTALDVTVQAQILALIQKLKAESGTSLLLITHNLGVVAEMCDEVAIMYAGRIVEQSSVRDIFSHPKHPYTKMLLEAVPKPGRRRLLPIPGSVPNLLNTPPGCAFHPRCPYVTDICSKQIPPLRRTGELNTVACHLYAEDEEGVKV
jgi:oligopeptide/dipeptide ABC transporter ATP-binding protein